MNQPCPHTISYRNLPPSEPDSPLAVEWEFYRKEVGRLLAEGHAGRHVLIKSAEIIGIYNSHNEAVAEGHRRYLMQAFLVHEIQTEERVFRSTFRWRGWPRKLIK
jgi:hypothetical protein